MPSSRKIVHQTVYFDSLFNLSCPSVPTAVAGSLTPPKCERARVHGSVWGCHLGLARSSKCEPQPCHWLCGHPFSATAQQNTLSAIPQQNTFAATAHRDAFDAIAQQNAFAANAQQNALGAVARLQPGWAQQGAKPAPSHAGAS